ncbi:MAG: fused MFS/spermidine synthase [Candidatus Micrarchaeota archaeon]|nr:fused MFS/spermidine synthase [Candidatus Micrarchaeota archaeon]
MNPISSIENGFIRLAYLASGWKILERRGNIFVLEDRGSIIMKCGYSTTYSILNKKSIYTHSYFDYFIPLAYLHNRPRILVIGMGGGTIPLQMARLLGSDASIEVVDVNGSIMELAKRHFLKGESIKTAIGDGVEYLSGKRREYDLIILDAFEGPRIPQQFLERRFAEIAGDALADDGILGINVDTMDGRVKSYMKIMQERFKVYSIRPSLTSTNLILICSKKLDNNQIADAVNSRIKKTGENEFLVRRYAGLHSNGKGY